MCLLHPLDEFYTWGCFSHVVQRNLFWRDLSSTPPMLRRHPCLPFCSGIDTCQNPLGFYLFQEKSPTYVFVGKLLGISLIHRYIQHDRRIIYRTRYTTYDSPHARTNSQADGFLQREEGERCAPTYGTRMRTTVVGLTFFGHLFF